MTPKKIIYTVNVNKPYKGNFSDVFNKYLLPRYRQYCEAWGYELRVVTDPNTVDIEGRRF